MSNPRRAAYYWLFGGSNLLKSPGNWIISQLTANFEMGLTAYGSSFGRFRARMFVDYITQDKAGMERVGKGSCK